MISPTFRYAILAGPTGSGKTSLTQSLDPQKFEVLSFDSRQVYTDLAVGTTAPTEKEKQTIAHHLVDFLSPRDQIHAKSFVDIARKKFFEVLDKNKTPLLVVGTGFYLKAFLNGMFPVPPVSKETKDFVESLSDAQSEILLKEKDPKALEFFFPNDFYRIRRALEVVLSGVLWSEVRQTTEGGLWKEFPDSRFVGFFLDLPRKELYQRIEERIPILMERGFLQETESVRSRFGEDCPGLKSLGYNFALAFLKGEVDRKNFLDSLAQSHRNYAKRQVTWFRKETFLSPILREDALSELRKID